MSDSHSRSRPEDRPALRTTDHRIRAARAALDMDQVLRERGRVTAPELADALGWAPATARARLDAAVAAGDLTLRAEATCPRCGAGTDVTDAVARADPPMLRCAGGHEVDAFSRLTFVYVLAT